MRLAISFLLSKNFQLFVKKNEAYYTPIGVLYLIGTFLQPVKYGGSSDAKNSRSACFDWHNFIRTEI